MPPFALAWPQGHIFAAGCDKRVCIINNIGKTVKTFDYSKDHEEHDFVSAISSPSGQVGNNFPVFVTSEPNCVLAKSV